MKTIKFLSLISIFLFTTPSWAFFTVGESGELIKPGKYGVGAEPQFVFDSSGFNFAGFFDAAFGKDGSVRAKMGVGDTSFEAALSYKWIPIPDYGNQPAVGGKIEANYARKNSANIDALRIMPIVSKNFDTIYGPITPYGSLPLSLVGTPSGNQTDIQLVAGCEIRPPNYQKWLFGAELGVNLNNAFSYIAGNVTYYLDESEVSSRKKIK